MNGQVSPEKDLKGTKKIFIFAIYIASQHCDKVLIGMIYEAS